MISKIQDKSLHYGMQNFFFCDTVSDATYQYVIYQDKIGIIFVARFKLDGTNGRYAVSKAAYATVLAGVAGLTYVLPSELQDLMIQVNL